MNQVSFDISSDRQGRAGAVTAGGAASVRSPGVGSAPGCVGRSIMRLFRTTGHARPFAAHETLAASLRHEPRPVAA